MSEAAVYLIIILALVIFVPVIFAFIREIDFKRQINGKRAERKANDNQKVSYEKPESKNQDVDIIGTAGVTNVRVNGHMSEWSGK